MTPGVKTLLGLWGTIVGAAVERLPTAQLYSAIYNAQRDQGVVPGGFGMRDVNTLRSMATSWVRSPQALERAQGSSPLGSEMIALAPWSRGLAARNADPAFEIRYEYLRTNPIEGQSPWVTIGAEKAGRPQSVEELRDLVDQHAADVTEGDGSPPFEAGQSFAGIGQIIVLAL